MYCSFPCVIAQWPLAVLCLPVRHHPNPADTSAAAAGKEKRSAYRQTDVQMSAFCKVPRFRLWLARAARALQLAAACCVACGSMPSTSHHYDVSSHCWQRKLMLQTTLRLSYGHTTLRAPTATFWRPEFSHSNVDADLVCIRHLMNAIRHEPHLLGLGAYLANFRPSFHLAASVCTHPLEKTSILPDAVKPLAKPIAVSCRTAVQWQCSAHVSDQLASLTSACIHG